MEDNQQFNSMLKLGLWETASIMTGELRIEMKHVRYDYVRRIKITRYWGYQYGNASHTIQHIDSGGKQW